MVNSKRKGSQFERDAAKLLNEQVLGTWKRVAGSGALGAILEEPTLQGDIIGKEIPGLPKGFRLDAKVGYGGAKQLTVQKEWLDKIRKEAEATYSIPAVICKFSGSREGVKVFVVMDLEAFAELVNRPSEIKEELDKIIWNTVGHRPENY
jgi:Holliday junction resolvase